MNNYILIGAGILIGILIGISRYVSKKQNSEYGKMYNEILTSDKYKVKGQHD